MDLDTAIAKLERTQARLQNLEAFYVENMDGWLTLAKVTVSNYLSTHKPEETDADRWTEIVEEVTMSVVASLFNDAETMGVMLFLSTDGAQPKGEGYKGPVTYDTVLRWVEAGRQGDPLGKRIMGGKGQIDHAKTDPSIAWRVFHALRVKSGANIDRMRAAVEAFAREGGLFTLDAWVTAILPVWVEVFTARASEDFQEWVERMTAGL